RFSADWSSDVCSSDLALMGSCGSHSIRDQQKYFGGEQTFSGCRLYIGYRQREVLLQLTYNTWKKTAAKRRFTENTWQTSAARMNSGRSWDSWVRLRPTGPSFTH